MTTAPASGGGSAAPGQHAPARQASWPAPGASQGVPSGSCCQPQRPSTHVSRVHAELAHTFGPFTLDSSTRQLLNNGAEIHLSLKAFDLLAFLIDNRARPVPKEELQKHLWPSTFVLETNLASLVAEIRRALNDSADDPQYVRTMHRVGYWFIGHVVGEAERNRPPASPRAVRFWIVWDNARVALNDGENIVGRAQLIFFSVHEGERAWEIWRWPFSVRWGRLFTIVR